MTERRCDGCALWEKAGGAAQMSNGEHTGACHRSEYANTEGLLVASWWCEHFWPVAVPLPEPWNEEAPSLSDLADRISSRICDSIRRGLDNHRRGL